MSEQQRAATIGLDALGIALFALAVFLGASVVMSMVRGIAPEASNASTQAIAGLVQAMGGAASLLLALGFAWIGARQWFGGSGLPTARQAAGIAGFALGLAFLLGSLGEQGGTLGASVRTSAGAALGTLLGAVVSAGAVWWAFFPTVGKQQPWNSENYGQEHLLNAASVTKPTWGVSEEEAQALLPESQSEGSPGSPPESSEEDPFAIPLELPALYPPDVRLVGRIPEGARPIDVHEPIQIKASALPAQPLPGWAPETEAGDQEPAGRDLAFLEPGEEAAEQALERSVTQSPSAEQRGERSPGELIHGEAVGLRSLPLPSWERGHGPEDSSLELAPVQPLELDPDGPGEPDGHPDAPMVSSAGSIEIEEEECGDAGACGGEEHEELVRRAGDLILERNRVSVSLLQREFELDFKQATELLDRLQGLGLIGPYIGGQRRDILMSPATWRALTSA
jgi:hypothetical protein